jgi:uncharacterized protein
MLRTLLIAVAVFLAAVGGHAAAVDPNEIAVPKLSAHVMDLTGTLSADERSSIDAKLVEFERARGSQVAVLLVPSIGTEPIEDFATRVTDQWQLGRKGVDDGVLLVVAKEQRKLRIQTGRGVQGTLTDALSKRIVSDVIAPHFRNGDFAGGIDAGVDAIMKAVQGEELPLPEPPRRSAQRVDTMGSLSNLFFLAIFVVPFVGFILRRLVGRFFGAGLTGGITGLAAWFVLGSLGIGIVAALFAFVIVLFSGTGIGRGIGPGGWMPGGFGGGGFGGGGGGGGGFSGGGGSFDGGGASGNW